MISLNFAGTVCWVIASIFGIAFAYEAKDLMTKRGVALKGLTSLSIAAYAATLIALNGKSSEAGTLFVFGLVLASIGDIVMGVLQVHSEGTPNGLLKEMAGHAGIKVFGVGVTGILFVVSYFFQMVAFLKAIAAHTVVTNYVAPFMMFFFLPLIFTVIGGVLSKFKVPETNTNIFIIGVFYILLTSALFASAVIFSASLFQTDPVHAGWIAFGATVFFLSMLMVALRYSTPEKYESSITRVGSRVLTFLGRMILAGCAFLF